MNHSHAALGIPARVPITTIWYYTKSEKKSTVGIGIKLFNVPGVNMLDNESWPANANESATNVDFTLQNYPVFFARDAIQMAQFKTAAVNGTITDFFAENPDVKDIIDAMAQDVGSILDSTLWSCIPYKLGTDYNMHYCKYILKPNKLPPASGVDETSPQYLKHDLEQRLKSGPASFTFQIQVKNLPTQLIDDAQNDWTDANGNLDVNNIYDVATLYLPQQDISVRGQEEYSESLSFNPWRCLEVNQPVGSIAEARRVVYEASAKMRRNLNGQVLGEPIAPRPTSLYPATGAHPLPAWPVADPNSDENPSELTPLLPAPTINGLNNNILDITTLYGRYYATVPKYSGYSSNDTIMFYLNGINNEIVSIEMNPTSTTYGLDAAPLDIGEKSLLYRVGEKDLISNPAYFSIKPSTFDENQYFLDIQYVTYPAPFQPRPYPLLDYNDTISFTVALKNASNIIKTNSKFYVFCGADREYCNLAIVKVDNTTMFDIEYSGYTGPEGISVIHIAGWNTASSASDVTNYVRITSPDVDPTTLLNVKFY